MKNQVTTMKLAYSFIVLLSLFVHQAVGASYIYFQNNTSLSFNATCSQTGSHTMDASEWWGINGTISPWELESNVLWSNRDQGIEDGTDFFLTVNLESGGESFNLEMKLNGNFVGSDMWQSVSGPGFNHLWYGDNDFHEEIFSILGKTFTLKYSAYFTGGDDDILFVIEEHDPFPVLASDLSDKNILNVLSYNIYMLAPLIAFTDQSTRAEFIADHVNGYDVIIINEAFDNSARDILTSNLMVEYPYFTDVVDESGSLEDGGVLIYSRWPIGYSEDIVYSDCDGDDCLAAKGAMYARIDKLGTNYHVFGTHTQAWADPVNVATRQAQMAQLKSFVDAKSIPASEAVILGGDFNVEKTANFLNEYNQMFTILDSSEPDYFGQLYTFDETLSDYASGGDFEYLDYVMYENAHRIPDTSANTVIVLRSIEDDMWDIFDLSDHLAVQGRFVFPDPSVSLDKVEESADIFVSPNPSSSTISINLESPKNDAFEIHTMLGKLVQSGKLAPENNTIDISDLPPNVYFISIRNTRVKFVRM